MDTALHEAQASDAPVLIYVPIDGGHGPLRFIRRRSLMATEQYKKGMKEMRRHLGPAADSWIKSIREISPEFAKINVEFPFGELYTRDVLDDKTRELCTIAALTVQGYSLAEVNIHVKGAINCGVSRGEIVEVITQMIAYCGFPAATNALRAAKKAFDELDGDSPSTS
jgi:4-carboxymuconolactone decarboxylase